jgi:hypothetical protein
MQHGKKDVHTLYTHICLHCTQITSERRQYPRISDTDDAVLGTYQVTVCSVFSSFFLQHPVDMLCTML